MKGPAKAATLAKRIEKRAQGMQSERGLPVIRKIIEAREIIARLHCRPELSWVDLVGLLAEEGVNLSQGTLRNYMHKIGRAEAALKDNGVLSPTDEEIHVALGRARPTKPVLSAPSPRPQQANVAQEVGKQRDRSLLPASSLTRNPKREL